jgi:hypothetical protein
MTDLVNRLRQIAQSLPQVSWPQPWLRPEDTTEWEAADEIENLTKACHEWAEVSQQNYQRAKAAQAAMEEHKHGALEAIRLVGQSARNAGLWQGKAEGLAGILTECVNDLEQAINGNVHKESMEELIDRARYAVDNLHK